MAVLKLSPPLHIPYQQIQKHKLMNPFYGKIIGWKSKIPGPKLAAITGWYGAYFELLHKGVGGQYTFHIKRLHEVYGPIVRISPQEVHIDDPNFYSVIYTNKEGYDKSHYLKWRFGAPAALFSTPDHQVHRMRRAAQDPFFAKSRISRLSPRIQSKANMMCARLAEDFMNQDRPVLLDDLFASYTADIMTEYAFDRDFKYLADLDFASPFVRAIRSSKRFLINNGNLERLGKGWVARFLRRHPEIRTLKGTVIDFKRLYGASPASINVLFERFALPEIKAIKWRNRYNADEMGVMEGMGENAFVLGEAFRKRILLKDAFKRGWITIIACVSADGRSLLPFVIFSGVDVQQQWFPDSDDEAYENWYFTTLENGWTSTEIGLKWLREVFIPNTKPEDPDEWRLLVIDGHNSHTTEEFMWMCLQNKIYIIFLLFYASHVFQPLDVGVFATLKRRFRYWFRERCYGRVSEAIDKTDFLWALSKAWNEVMMTSKYIMKGWEVTGLRLINKAKVLNNRDLARIEKSLVEVDLTFGNPTTRLLFRKFAKALNEKTSKLSAAEVHNSQLTAALEKAKPKTCRKVQPEPNEEFVRMISVRKVKVEVGAVAKGRSTATRRKQQQNKRSGRGKKGQKEADCIIVRSD
ncbi:hypothetical protein DL769_009155 [Monosporascus sp. CRB-8-3]|nr:hypothetical protein DL769_009155 [Monosporascus sp. CRB-8-3]